MQARRQQLPAWESVDAVLEALRRRRVVLIAGETGCGKSTQIPQYLLDASPSAKIVVTQPRRIAATSLAQRVAQERCEAVGSTVGYAIHMENKTSRETRCTYCTTGVFRRRLLADPQLQSLTHIVLDEVHERELNGDFILIILKRLMEESPHLRLVLMSATLQLEVFQEYFPGCATISIPGRTFPVERFYLDDVADLLHQTPELRPHLGPAFAAAGRVRDEKDFKRQVAQQEKHPDQVCGYGSWLHQALTPERLEDGCHKHDVLQQGRGTVYDIPIIDGLIAQLDWEASEAAEAEPGAILVFLPGWGDIDQAKRRLYESLDTSRFQILPCHSQIRSEQQHAIFKRPPPGVRKIILASNIAETSITIEDVNVVIDAGRAKETSYDPYLKVGTLATTFVSKASAEQRAGRAGRTSEGRCYHLFSRRRSEEMEAFRQPELLRSPLEDVCLHTAHLLAQHGACSGGAGIAGWLAQAPQPPDAIAVKNAVELLKVLGALTPVGEISGLGVKLASLPLPVSMARSVIWAVLLGCLDPILTILSAASGRDPFQLPQEGGKGAARGAGSFGQLSAQLRRVKQELTRPVESDHVALLRAVERYEEARSTGGEHAARSVCDRYSLNARGVQSVIDMREKMRKELRQQGLLSDQVLAFANRHKQHIAVILAVVTAGVFPNVAARRPPAKKIQAGGGRVAAATHPQSVLDTGGKGGKDGKDGKDGKGGQAGPAEWLCYTEMMQVEERYSITGVSRASPAALLLLCGDDPVELQGAPGSADVSASLLQGWVEFLLPRDQANRLQNLRYTLRRAFITYCESPQKFGEQRQALECAVAVLRASMDDAGRPVTLANGYAPRVPAYSPGVTSGDLEEYAAAMREVAEARTTEAESLWAEDMAEDGDLEEPGEEDDVAGDVAEGVAEGGDLGEPGEEDDVAGDVAEGVAEDGDLGELGEEENEGEDMAEDGDPEELGDEEIVADDVAEGVAEDAAEDEVDAGEEPTEALGGEAADELEAELAEAGLGEAADAEAGAPRGEELEPEGVDLALDMAGDDDGALAALRFMAGDLDYKESAEAVPVAAGAPSKRRRVSAS